MDFDPIKAARTSDPETSKEAARSFAPIAADMQTRVLNAIEILGDATSEEVADASGLDHAQAWRRFSELRRAGLIETIGLFTRTNRSGRQARVYRLVIR